MLSLNISYPYLTQKKIHCFADNSKEGMKYHQMRGGTQAQLGMTLRITLNVLELFQE
jgi:hypothetical protein